MCEMSVRMPWGAGSGHRRRPSLSCGCSWHRVFFGGCQGVRGGEVQLEFANRRNCGSVAVALSGAIPLLCEEFMALRSKSAYSYPCWAADEIFNR